MKAFRYILTALSVLFLCPSCYIHFTEKARQEWKASLNENLEEKCDSVREVKPFSALRLSGPFSYEYTPSKGTPAVRIEAPASQLGDIIITDEDGQLRIEQKKRSRKFEVRSDIHIHISGGELESISMAGSGDFHCEALRLRENDRTLSVQLAGSGDIDLEKVHGEEIQIQLAGSGDIRIGQLRTDRLKVWLAGSGDITLAGQAKEASFQLNGSGDIDAESLRTGSVLEKEVQGSGKIRLGR